MVRSVLLIVLVGGCVTNEPPPSAPSVPKATSALASTTPPSGDAGAERASTTDAGAVATTLAVPADEAPDTDVGEDSCGNAPKLDHRQRLTATPHDRRKMESASGFFAIRGAPPTADARTPLVIRLDGPARAAVAKPLDLKVSVENAGAKPVVLGLAVDGSFEHWRSPFVDLYARDEATGRVYRLDFHGARCGNVNMRTKADFVTLARGARREPAFGEWAAHVSRATLDAPGRYALWVVYTSCDGRDMGLALSVSGAGRLPVPYRGVVASAPITIEVTP